MGKFQAGQLKPVNSGRRKGSPNRKTTFLKEALDRLGVDLPQKIAELLPQISVEKQIDVCLELMQYVFPKRKAVEISGQEGRPIEVDVRNDNLKAILADPDALAALEILEAKLGHGSEC